MNTNTNNYDIFIQNLINFSEELGCFGAEEEIVEKLSCFNFDPLANFEFKPIFTYEAYGDFFLAPNYRNEKLIENNGIMLYEEIGTFTSSNIDVCNLYEIWLLEDMSILTTFSYNITIGSENDKFTSSYRLITEEFGGEFDLECFLDDLTELILENGHRKYNHIEI